MAQWTRATLEREAVVAAAVEEALAEAGGGGATEYDSVADMPSTPADGDLAVVSGRLFEANGGVWVAQSPLSPETVTSTSAWGNVPNLLDFVVLTFDSDSPEIPTRTSAWSAVP
jgi:hypothetical protein